MLIFSTGDPASNTLSWRWVAGIQTLGKTYLARPENIAKYTKSRFYPEGKLATSAAPIDSLSSPRPASLDFDTPLISGKPSLLLITDDDLGLKTANLPTIDLVCVVSINTKRARSPHGASDQVENFVDNALGTAVNDYAGKHRLIVQKIEADDQLTLFDVAKKFSAQKINSLQNLVGPARDAIADMVQVLVAQGIPYIQIVRPWDQISWPYATKGFFKFKDAIPSILAGLQKLLRPFAIDTLGNALTTAQFGDGFFTTQSIQYNADFFFS